jgi:hypothetical protein
VTRAYVLAKVRNRENGLAKKHCGKEWAEDERIDDRLPDANKDRTQLLNCKAV